MTKSKEELLIENAILKSGETFRTMLKEELSPLNTHIRTLETRVDNLDKRVKEVEDIVEPFGIIRKRFWLLLIAGTLTVSVAGNKLTEMIDKLIN